MIEVSEKEAIYDLAAAIIIRAANDYREAYSKYLKARRKSKKDFYRLKMEECELFFRSSWFGVLADLDGEELIKKLKVDIDDSKGISSTGISTRQSNRIRR